MADTSSIGEKAFYNSSSIHEIKFLGTILPAKVGTNAFDTRYSVNGDLFSMKAVDAEDKTDADNEDILALKTGDKFGSTAINTSAGNVLNLEKDYEFKPTGDLAWSYNHTTGVLTLSVNDSTTVMKSYAAGLAPWNSLKPYVTEIVVNDGVTSVSLEGLSDFPNCTKLTIGSSVASFGGANNLVKLEELVFYATNCGSMSTNVLQNMGAESQNGVKVTFQSLSDGVILRVPQNFLNTSSVNVTELVFISAGGLTLQSNSMFFTTHVTKITYVSEF